MRQRELWQAMKTFDLRSHPDVAREIGLLMMYAANLEILFIPILTELTGYDATLPILIAIEVNNLTAKMNILFEVAKEKLGDPFADIVYAAKDHVMAAISYRNKLAHGLYVTDPQTNDLELLSNLLKSRSGKISSVPLRASTIERHREALRDAIDRVIQAGGDRLWNPLEVSSAP
jgi:hypothetical protein